MPRLGSLPTPERRGASPRRPATAYAGAGRHYNISNIVLLLAFTFILRNMLFHDYRTEEINQLRASGKSPEEISQYVPTKTVEKRQTLQERRNEYLQLKTDVALLKNEVNVLKSLVAGGGALTKTRKSAGAVEPQNDATMSRGDGDDTTDGEEEAAESRTRRESILKSRQAMVEAETLGREDETPDREEETERFLGDEAVPFEGGQVTEQEHVAATGEDEETTEEEEDTTTLDEEPNPRIGLRTTKKVMQSASITGAESSTTLKKDPALQASTSSVVTATKKKKIVKKKAIAV